MVSGSGETSMESRSASVHHSAVEGRCFVPPDGRDPAVGPEVTTARSYDGLCRRARSIRAVVIPFGTWSFHLKSANLRGILRLPKRGDDTDDRTGTAGHGGRWPGLHDRPDASHRGADVRALSPGGGPRSRGHRSATGRWARSWPWPPIACTRTIGPWRRPRARARTASKRWRSSPRTTPTSRSACVSCSTAFMSSATSRWPTRCPMRRRFAARWRNPAACSR